MPQELATGPLGIDLPPLEYIFFQQLPFCIREFVPELALPT